MYIGLTPELTELRDELRDYYAKLLTPEVEDELSHRRGHRPGAAQDLEADGRRRLGRHRLAEGVRRPGPHRRSSSSSSSTSRCAAGAPVPMLTINSVAPTIMRYGSQEQKDFFLPKILAGEIHFSHRLHRARRRHRPRVAQDARPSATATSTSSTARRSSPARDRRRLHLARGAHRPEREEAQGHLDHHRPDRHARLQVRADQEHGRPRHERHVLRGRAGPGRQPRRRGEPGLEPHHQPAQPRAGHALLERRGRAPARGHDRVGRRRRSSPTAAASSTRSGCRSTWPGCTPSSSSCSSRTGRSRPSATQGAPLEPGRRVDDQGVRHRVLPGGVPAAHGDHRPVGAGEVRLARRGARGSARGAHCAACTSSPSAAAPTRCSAT